MVNLASNRIAESLQTLLERNLPTIRARVDLIERAVAQTPLLADDLRLEAAAAAHKLAGSMGMFGYPEATLVARELEKLLLARTPDSAALAALAFRLRTALPINS
jgi:HPt (histidine-containing phosphotransfer) domain-containing protein